jgi:hypothetical protein
MVMIGDENGYDSVSVSFYSQTRMPISIQIQSKPTTLLRFRTVTEESKLTDRLSWVTLNLPPPTWQVGKRYGQILISPFPYLIMSHGEGGGGHRKGRRGFLFLNYKPDTGGQLYLTLL